MHSHYYGGALPTMLRARTDFPRLHHRPNTTEVMVAMNGEFPFSPAYHDPAVGLDQMDRFSITHRLITFPGALGVDLLPATAAPAISAFNAHLADLGHSSGGRLIGLAGLPLADIPIAVREVAQIRAVGLPGIILPGNYFLTEAAVTPLRPILAEASRLGALVMIHPGLLVGQHPPVLPKDHPQYRISALDLQNQIAQTALTVILSDMMETYPGIRFQIVNLGGTLPFIFERLESIARHRNPDAPFPTHRLRAMWYDCASLGPRALEAAVALLGADRIMLGSDYPIFKENPVQVVQAANLTPDQRDQILGQTAATLLAGLGVGPLA
jgi:aminocarboxymuconate-semialdehyde decarboxylase